VALPDLAIRVAWIAIDAAVAAWALRRIGLPGYWIAFPPIVQTIVLGHPEVLLLGLLVAGGGLSGLSILVKPYAVFPLLAERRWRALGVATATLLVTAPFLPWQRFFAELPEIVGTIIRQNNGDPVFGDPVWMAVGALSLLSLGWRRGLWLAVPVMWPYAQPNYKVMTVPALPPLLALIWAIPIPGHTLTGVVVLATLVAARRWRALPAWVEAGIREPVRLKLPSQAPVGSLDLPRASMAGSA